MQVVDNVIPWIAGEEEKVERETRKILGRLREGGGGGESGGGSDGARAGAGGEGGGEGGDVPDGGRTGPAGPGAVGADPARFVDHPVAVSAACNRVPVLDGHTACVSVGLARRASLDEVRAAWAGFLGEPQRLGLPTAPARPVHLLDRADAPQPRLHRDLEGGMAASVGRLRRCPLFDFKFVTLSHNTVRGAAGGALLLAELAVAKGLLPGVGPPAAAR
jgi:aspartate-semialdehyde dehydrogenase